MRNMDAMDAKKAATSYLLELKEDYYRWYSKSTKSHKNRWDILNLTVMAASVLTTILAALQTSELEIIKHNIYVFQWLLILVPIIGTASSAVLIQIKSLELYQLREKGRERIQYLIDEGTRQLMIATSDEEFSQVHKFLVDEVSRLEIDQADHFFKTTNT